MSQVIPLHRIDATELETSSGDVGLRRYLSIELEVVERLMEAVRLSPGSSTQIEAAIDHLVLVVARLPERNRGYYTMQVDDLRFLIERAAERSSLVPDGIPIKAAC